MSVVTLGPRGLTSAAVLAVARAEAPVELDLEAYAAMERSAAVVAAVAESESPAYGVNSWTPTRR